MNYAKHLLIPGLAVLAIFAGFGATVTGHYVMASVMFISATALALNIERKGSGY